MPSRTGTKVATRRRASASLPTRPEAAPDLELTAGLGLRALTVAEQGVDVAREEVRLELDLDLAERRVGVDGELQLIEQLRRPPGSPLSSTSSAGKTCGSSLKRSFSTDPANA